jgi:curli biogenesis system outer membrane secretion channel CsgG
VEVAGDNEPSHNVKQMISNELNKTGRFSAVESSEEAQAALKVNATQDAKSGKGAFVVRLVNESGYVLWPAKTSGSGTKYSGSIEEVVPAIIRDLVREVAKQQTGRK